MPSTGGWTRSGWRAASPRRALEESLFGQAVQAALKTELRAVGIELDVWLDPRPKQERGVA